ncbi:MAG: hypothetical protein ACTSVW_01945 [Candidatus Njordarchaeales archaeon]
MKEHTKRNTMIFLLILMFLNTIVVRSVTTTTGLSGNYTVTGVKGSILKLSVSIEKTRYNVSGVVNVNFELTLESLGSGVDRVHTIKLEVLIDVPDKAKQVIKSVSYGELREIGDNFSGIIDVYITPCDIGIRKNETVTAFVLIRLTFKEGVTLAVDPSTHFEKTLGQISLIGINDCPLFTLELIIVIIVAVAFFSVLAYIIWRHFKRRPKIVWTW